MSSEKTKKSKFIFQNRFLKPLHKTASSSDESKIVQLFLRNSPLRFAPPGWLTNFHASTWEARE